MVRTAQVDQLRRGSPDDAQGLRHEGARQSAQETSASAIPICTSILEPGSAFAWQTGPLVAHVVDVVEDKGIRTAILDVSFTCHMPDCLEMPYMPEVRGADSARTLNIQHRTSTPTLRRTHNLQPRTS